MQITVKHPNGKCYTLNVDSNESIDNVKIKVNDATGIPTNRQRLYFADSEMESGTTLADARVVDGSLVDLGIQIISNRA
ncbi:ubiquitin [Annulohypoxylon stygium]|nr:ubiquitin [Annulohypoxylon stygium]